MKYLKLIMALAVCSLMDHFAIAADGPSPQTAHSFDRDKFCDEGAKNRIGKLNSITKNNVDDIEALKRDINELEAKKNIISGVQKLKGEYLDALNEVINENDIAKTTKSVKKKSIDQFKTLLNKTLILDAISLMVKGNFQNLITTAENSQNQTLANHDYVLDLCTPSNRLNNSAAESFCSNYGEQSYVQKFTGTKLQADSIRETINHYMDALSKIPADKSIEVDVSKILATIPKEIRPSEILEILKRQSPTMTQALVGAKSHEDIVSCIEGSDETCDKILKNENRDNLKNQIKQEIGDATNAISAKMALLNKNIDLENTKDLESIFHSFDNPLEAREKGNHESLKKQLEKVQNYSESLIKDNQPLFNNKYTSSITSKNGFKLIGLEDGEYEDFINKCTIPKETKSNDLKDKVIDCKAIIEKLSEKANNAQKEMENDIKVQKDKLTKLLDESGKLNKIEKIKQYVQQRYIRSCPQAKTATLAQSNLYDIPCSQISASTDSDSGDEIKSLWKKITNVIGNLQNGNRTSDKKGELGTFSKDELKVYMNYCQNVSQDDSIIKESCREINQYYAEIANQKETKEWEEYNKKYWVEYDSKKGYIAYEKKSNLRILGEGLSQSMGGIYPIWFGNFQMENQIQMLTNQAMYQKQMMYMNSFDSPWMQQPYFQGSYFPPMSSTPATQGFNFGP
ncbi:MAG: hypothetical protein EHM20_01815 [Alphaproteobacteria bacterium]|nr:MAG: hypothetical protein EHM20_01815 [Alphaproteobacteria bacterium]